MQKKGKIFIRTFGCIQNTADSERVKAYYWEKGFSETDNWKDSDMVIINTCIVRESAENRAYGLINEIDKWNRNPSVLRTSPFEKGRDKKIKIIVTGCLAGTAYRDKTGNKLKQLQINFPEVDQFLPIDKISFQIDPLRGSKETALIPISSGCSNFCSFCIVPFARGPEVSRSFEEILKEVDGVIKKGFKKVMLIGQNVNSYGSDLNTSSTLSWVHMGKKRIRSLFHVLLEEVAKKDFEKISFVSSNPWDFSDELIDVIARYPNIDKLLHLPLQAGDDKILEKMNRGYTAEEYLDLIKKIRAKVKDVRFSTDIIIGFPGEDEEAFNNTVEVCKKANFEIAYLNKYSPRKGTVSAKMYPNDIPQAEKKRRWRVLNEMIN